MAAYGSIARTTSVNTTLHPTVWHTEAKEGRPVHTCTIHHLTLETARHLPELISFLSSTFAQVVEDGMTYPQEGPIDQPSFESYFFAGDVFIGISIPTTDVDPTYDLIKMEDGSSIETGYGPDMARGGRTWEQSVTGFYYVCEAFSYHRRVGLTTFCCLGQAELSRPIFSCASHAHVPRK